MERSNGVSSHILINATTSSRWDRVDFAIIHLTEWFKAALQQRLSAVQQFVGDDSFYNLIYWDTPLGFYCNPKDKPFTETMIKPGEGWAFVHLDDNEEQAFAVPQYPLMTHQLVISKHCYANFKALSKYSNEEYLTEWFSISQALYDPGVESIVKVPEKLVSFPGTRFRCS
jgi:hypothetical protein